MLAATLFFPLSSRAAEEVGQAVLIKTEVSGAGGSLSVDDPVHRDERIRTSPSGLGQFTFRDGTKLAVGWGSSVTIDRFVFDDSGAVKKLTLNAAKGTFRWISGNSDHSAYQIVTPAGTIGVRGTAFDFYVGRGGTTAVVLLSGEAQFCGAGGCSQLKKQCDAVIAKPNGSMSETRANPGMLKSLRNDNALPFLSGGQQLFGRMGLAGGGSCGMATAQTRARPNGAQPSTRSQSPSPSPSPSAPNAPSPRSEPSSPRSTPSTPSTPNSPDPPSRPDRHDHDGRHHGHHDHDNHDHHDGRGDHGRDRGGWDHHR
jgi:hypothetical protein